MNKEVKYRDGSVGIVNISSDDNLKVNLRKKYVLVGYQGNKHVDNFKNSIIGTDIGISSNGFANIMIVSSLLAIAVLFGMYLLFRV